MVKAFIHRALQRAGFDLIRYNASRFEDIRFGAMLAAHKVNLVFDVGANAGQFGKQLRQTGYQGRIVSFEPTSAAWERLTDASVNDPMWEIAPRCAIGSEDGEIEIHIAGNSYSSSALNMLDSLLTVAPQCGYIGTEPARLCRLDTIGSEYLRPDSVLLIKIDTQGFEGPVLQGAPELIRTAVGLQLELSLVPLYENQLLLNSLMVKVQNAGFEMWDCSPGFVDHRTGRVLQVDATFFRP
jgi:FkbM family methyltransferase